LDLTLAILDGEAHRRVVVVDRVWVHDRESAPAECRALGTFAPPLTVASTSSSTSLAVDTSDIYKSH
jgi:hypothetical protein